MLQAAKSAMLENDSWAREKLILWKSVHNIGWWQDKWDFSVQREIFVSSDWGFFFYLFNNLLRCSPSLPWRLFTAMAWKHCENQFRVSICLLIWILSEWGDNKGLQGKEREGDSVGIRSNQPLHLSSKGCNGLFSLQITTRAAVYHSLQSTLFGLSTLQTLQCWGFLFNFLRLISVSKYIGLVPQLQMRNIWCKTDSFLYAHH